MAKKKRKTMKVGETKIAFRKIDGKKRKVKVTKLSKEKYRVRVIKPRGHSKKYHGFASKKVYLAFKAHWKKQKRKKKKKLDIVLETAKVLKEAAKAISDAKAPAGATAVINQIGYVESLDEKIKRVKQMLKRLEFEYLKRHISADEYNRRKFEYLEALRFLKSQKLKRNISEKAAKLGKQSAAPASKPVAEHISRPSPAPDSFGQSSIPTPEPIVPRAPKINPFHKKPEPITDQSKPSLGKDAEKDVEEKPTQKKIEKKIMENLKEIKKAMEKKPKPEIEKPVAEAPKEAEKEIEGKPAEKEPEPKAKEPEEEVYVPGKRPKIVVKESPEKAAELFKIKRIKIKAKQAEKEEKPEEIDQRPSKQPLLQTPIENFMQLLKRNKKLSFKKLSISLGWSIESVERVGLVLEKQGIVDVHYPTMITAKPSISFVKELPPTPRYEVHGKILREYKFLVDFVPAIVRIYQVREEHRPVYHLITPHIGPYTEVFFDELKEDIAEQIPIEVSEITDSKKGAELKKKFFAVARNQLKKYLSDSPPRVVDVLAGLLMHTMYGLGKIEILMADNQLEEIAINSSRSPITIYHKEFGWMQSTVFMPTEEEIYNYAAQVARKVGREITTLNPILDAHLISGDRINATLNPISSFGNTITIRRFARKPWTIIDFIGKSHTMNLQMASLLWMAMHYEMSIVIAGGTASGKTSCLNALSALIPSYHRIISIEDVREIMLPKYMHWNWVPLTTRNPNPEGMGEVSMLNLMQSSLRMRPDRIILGEIRRKREAEVLFEAMHTGHSVYSTLHADSSHQVIRRLTEPPINLPPLEVEAVDLILVQYRDRRRNLRRTYEISEIESGVSNEKLLINPVFKWDPRSDEWETINPATRLIRQLNLHTGMTEGEIAKDLESRAQILQWAVENKLGEIDQFGQLMKLFYSEPEILKKAVLSNEDPEKVMGDKQ